MIKIQEKEQEQEQVYEKKWNTSYYLFQGSLLTFSGFWVKTKPIPDHSSSVILSSSSSSTPQTTLQHYISKMKSSSATLL